MKYNACIFIPPPFLELRKEYIKNKIQTDNKCTGLMNIERMKDSEFMNI